MLFLKWKHQPNQVWFYKDTLIDMSTVPQDARSMGGFHRDYYTQHKQTQAALEPFSHTRTPFTNGSQHERHRSNFCIETRHTHISQLSSLARLWIECSLNGQSKALLTVHNELGYSTVRALGVNCLLVAAGNHVLHCPYVDCGIPQHSKTRNTLEELW